MFQIQQTVFLSAFSSQYFQKLDYNNSCYPCILEKNEFMRIPTVLCFMLFSITASFAQKPDVEKKLKELGLQLPANQKAIANYVKAVRSGNLIFLSGQGPTNTDGSFITGKVGRELTVQQGYEAARSAGLNLLASLKEEIGDLNKVKRIVKVLGMVMGHPGGDDFLAAPFFKKHPEYAWQGKYLRDMKAYPWTLFSADNRTGKNN